MIREPTLRCDLRKPKEFKKGGVEVEQRSPSWWERGFEAWPIESATHCLTLLKVLAKPANRSADVDSIGLHERP